MSHGLQEPGRTGVKGTDILAEVSADIKDIALGQARIEDLLKDINAKQTQLLGYKWHPENHGGNMETALDKHNDLEVVPLQTAMRRSTRRESDNAKVGSSAPRTSVPGIRKSTSWARQSVTYEGYDPDEAMWSDEVGPVEHCHSIGGRSLPGSWPKSVAMRAEVGRINTSVAETAVIKAMSRYDPGRMTLTLRKLGKPTAFNNQMHQVQFQAFDPTSIQMNIMDSLTCLVLMVDYVVNPFIIAWDRQVVGNGWAAALILSALFWTVDMAISLFTGYHQDGEIVRSPWLAAKRYLHTWFAVDFTLCLTDWVNIILEYVFAADRAYSLTRSHSNSNPVVYMRIMRCLKLLKLARAGRLARFFDKLQMLAWKWPDTRRLALKILGVVWFVFMVSHFLACVWFIIGRYHEEESGESWLDLPARFDKLSNITYNEAYLSEQYLTALHWTVAQLTMGNSEIMPANSLERMFTIALLIAGLLFGSTVVSLFSASIVQHIMTRLEKATKLDKMRQYLQQHGVSNSLSVQVLSQTMERLRDREVVHRDDVDMLMCLSTSLRLNLAYEICLPGLLVHPLYSSWAAVDQEAVLHLCREAVLSEFISAHMEVFLPGTDAKFAYHLINGEMTYNQPIGWSKVDKDVSQDVTGQRWLSEAALWSQWMHVGILTSQTLCEVLTINADAMWQLLPDHSEIASITAQYCRKYHTRIQAAKPPHAPWPNDLSVPFTEPTELLANYVGIGLLLRSLRMGKLTLTTGQVDCLKSELREEKCALKAQKDGTFHRVVFVEAIRVVSNTGMCFIQVGVWEQGDETNLKATCRYPAKKRARGELPQDVLKLLLEKELAEIQGHVRIQDQLEELEESLSIKYGITTTYHRTVHVATLEADISRLDLHRIEVSDAGEPVPDTIIGMVPREVFLFSDGRKHYLYAWLTSENFEVLRTGTLDQDLKTWLSATLTHKIRQTDV